LLAGAFQFQRVTGRSSARNGLGITYAPGLIDNQSGIILASNHQFNTIRTYRRPIEAEEVDLNGFKVC
jgi:hypothetical protein